MCVHKDEAKTKLDRLIEGMERLTVALETAFGRHPNGKVSAPCFGEDSLAPQPESQDVYAASI